MEVNQETGMGDRRYGSERASCTLSSLSSIMENRLSKSRYRFDPESHCTRLHGNQTVVNKECPSSHYTQNVLISLDKS